MSNTPKNCERPELCLLTEGSTPCAICPHRSDTPRTDARALGGEWIETDFARQLESELEQERALADRLAEALKQCLCGYTYDSERSLAAWKDQRKNQPETDDDQARDPA